MSRQLASWAQSSRAKRKAQVTLPGDLVEGLREQLTRKKPQGAPAPKPISMGSQWRTRLPGRHLMLDLLNLRLDVELVGADALRGLAQPLVFAANEQGNLDYQLFRRALPPRMRPTMSRPSRALARGKNVVVFADEPVGSRLVGEFSTVAAALANQHDVALVPVGLVGTFKLKDILKLALRTKPKVSIRFGTPIYVRGRSLEQATRELQDRVDQLVHEGELSWWTVEQRRAGTPAGLATPDVPRWRRLWQQADPEPSVRSRIWR